MTNPRRNLGLKTDFPLRQPPWHIAMVICSLFWEHQSRSFPDHYPFSKRGDDSLWHHPASCDEGHHLKKSHFLQLFRQIPQYILQKTYQDGKTVQSYWKSCYFLFPPFFKMGDCFSAKEAQKGCANESLSKLSTVASNLQ